MAHRIPIPSARLAIALVGIALTEAAFLRGNYLLGFGVGVVYGLVAIGMLWLFARSFAREGWAASIQTVVIGVLVFPIGCALAFPASVNSSVQHHIDMQATDRSIRAELKQVFESDTAFSSLVIEMTHRKGVCITIHGSIPSRRDLERLEERITRECPTRERCSLFWNVRLNDTMEYCNGLAPDLSSFSDDGSWQGRAELSNPDLQ